MDNLETLVEQVDNNNPVTHTHAPPPTLGQSEEQKILVIGRSKTQHRASSAPVWGSGESSTLEVFRRRRPPPAL